MADQPTEHEGQDIAPKESGDAPKEEKADPPVEEAPAEENPAQEAPVVEDSVPDQEQAPTDNPKDESDPASDTAPAESKEGETKEESSTELSPEQSAETSEPKQEEIEQGTKEEASSEKNPEETEQKVTAEEKPEENGETEDVKQEDVNEKEENVEPHVENVEVKQATEPTNQDSKGDTETKDPETPGENEEKEEKDNEEKDMTEQEQTNIEAEENPVENSAETSDEKIEEQTEEKVEQELETLQESGEVPTDAVGISTEPTAVPEADVDPSAPSPENAPSTSRYDKDATATGKATTNTTTLGDLGVGPNGTIRLELQSSDPINTPLKPFKPRQEHHMPDVITVRVPSDDGGFRDVVVEIEKNMKKKPFLGGYRHKETGIEFHHASAQTAQKQRSTSTAEKFCRDTQTCQQKHMYQQTTNDTSTQMTKIGVYVENMKDKLVVPGKYVTADEHKAKMLQQVIVIQKYYRRWLARNYVHKVREDKADRLAWEREEEKRKKAEKEQRIKLEFERRMNPKTNEDFALLYNALEKWHQEELGRINAELSGAERKAALCSLLDQETQLIASVGRHKLEADDENRNLIIQKFLDKAAAPKRWRGPDGKMTEMDTPYTIRAQQLRDIYNSINMKYLTQDERLDVLLTLKHTVKEHDCKLTQEIIELIDREADLLMRGVKETNLDGLRKRIATLFLQYIKTPTFNPEAARLIKVPQDSSTLQRNIYFCSGCNQYLPSTEFHLSSNSRAVGKCRSCSKTDNEARVRQDYSHYRYLLKNLRRQEDAYADGSKIAFLLQEGDLRYLLENVWSSQSILSAKDDVYDLTLVRWIRTEEWSPWNCILLTKEEASAHEKLENLEEAYGRVFIHRVQHKHTLARQYFSRLPGMAEHMRHRAEGSALSSRNGPSVSGKSLTSVQGSAIKAQ